MCASIGINVARDGSSDLQLVRNLGCTWIRIVAMPDTDLTAYFDRARSLGLQILLVLARESGGDFGRYQQMYGHRIAAVQVGNEPDLDSPSSWTMRPVELASLGQAARGTFGHDMPIVTAGLAGGHPEWLQGADLSWADAIAVHPYLKDAPNPSDLEDLPDVTGLIDGYKVYGKPILITEWGWWSDDEGRGAEEVGDMAAWAARTSDVEVYFHFCLGDWMVPPFGLYRSDGSAKPAAGTFISGASRAIQSLWPHAEQPDPQPEPIPVKPDPWQYFSAEMIAGSTNCPIDAVRDNWPRLVEQLGHCGINDRPTQVAMAGTVAIESAHTFRPVREAFYLGEPEPAESYRRTLRYYPFYGRGFIQITWRENYVAYGKAVDDLWQAGGAIDLVARPDDALDPDVSAAVSAVYFRDHRRADGYGIPEAARDGDWAEVRRLVQGGSAGLADLIAIANALAAMSPTPEPPPADPADPYILALKTLRDSTLPALRAQLDEADRQLQEATRICEQFVGERP